MSENNKPNHTPLILVLSGVLVGIPTFIFTYEIACWLSPSDKVENLEVLKLYFTFIAGLGIFYGFHLNNRRAKALEDNLEIQNRRINSAEDSRIDERFKNAIEHLGSEHQSMIIGGITVLNHIAIEKPSSFAKTVADILSSFLRSNHSDTTFQFVNQEIINILFHQAENTPYKEYNINLSNVDLSKFKFKSIDLFKVDLTMSILPREIQHVTFNSCNLSELKLKHIKFLFVKFNYSNLSNCIISFSEIVSIEFNDCLMLKGFDIVKSSITRGIFTKVNVGHFSLLSCALKDVHFINSDITNLDIIASFLINSSIQEDVIIYSMDLDATAIRSFEIKCKPTHISCKGTYTTNGLAFKPVNIYHHLQSRIGQSKDESWYIENENIRHLCENNDEFTKDDYDRIYSSYKKLVDDSNYIQ